MTFRKSWPKFALVATLLLVGLTAQAQVSLTLSPSLVTITPGGEAIFNGTIFNNTLTDVFLNQMSFAFSPPAGGSNFTEDTSVFFGNTPGILAAGDTYSGAIFGLVSSNSTPVATYNGVATILGGGDPESTGNIASSSFSIAVRSSSVPEPSAVALLGAGLSAGFIGMRKLRRKN